MSNGNPKFVESKACSKGPPKGGVWFTVSIKVHGQDVQVYLGGDLVTSIKSHFSPRARGGAFTFHNYQNVVLFRKLKIVPQFYASKKCVKTVQYQDYVTGRSREVAAGWLLSGGLLERWRTVYRLSTVS